MGKSVNFMFGEWDGFTVGRLNKLLAPHGIALKVESDKKRWGKKVRLSIEALEDRHARVAMAKMSKALEKVERAQDTLERVINAERERE